MATIVKVAKTAKEIDDVFWLRHEVYVIEDGKFGGKPLPEQRILDRFDTLSNTANIIAYENGNPVGTLRVTLNTEIGLPPDDIYPFKSLRESQTQIWYSEHRREAVFASAGMLAIRENWRRRRDVIMALMKLATGVCASWGVSHVIATSNHETTSVYEHLGFEALAEKIWVEHIGNYVVPMATPFAKPYEWAFGDLINNRLDSFWLENFSRHFERILLEPGEVLFKEGDEAQHAYILDSGWVSISRTDDEGRELTLATLSRGAIFGELALLDDQPRSATAISHNHTELIRLDKSSFAHVLNISSPLIEKLFSLFANRIRRTDDLAMVMAFAPQTGRVKFALQDLQKHAVPDKKNPNARVAKVGPKEIAKSAGVREFEVRRVLESEKLAGNIDYGEKLIRFFENAKTA